MAPFCECVKVTCECSGSVITDTFLVYETIEGPRFIRGHAVSLSMVGCASLIYAGMWWVLARKNQARREGKEDHRIENMSEMEIVELGDESPRFSYTT